MQFYSTNKQAPSVTFKKAAFSGLASDGGLYMPKSIPTLSSDFLKNMHTLSFQEIAFTIINEFLNDIPRETLKQIVTDAFNFDVPLVKLEENFIAIELFHGPTLAFKDFGSRFMARILSYYKKQFDKTLTILVATSGDTGAAVASGFYNIPAVEVVILYPKGKVTAGQEEMLAKWGKNITAFEVNGSFDDCQKIVKEAFTDKTLKKKFLLTSANSINIARLLPQISYYFWAFAQLKDAKKPLVFSIPSGNFGNLTAGIIAKRMGLPVAKFIAATNANNAFTKFLDTGIFHPQPSQKTISNAMDVGDPSNFARIIDLYDNNVATIRRDCWSMSFSDVETKKAIKEAYTKYRYILDPHGAVAYLGLQHYQKLHPNESCGVFLETAHPAKFKETVEDVLQIKMNVPDVLQQFATKKKHAISLSNTYTDFKQHLMDR